MVIIVGEIVGIGVVVVVYYNGGFWLIGIVVIGWNEGEWFVCCICLLLYDGVWMVYVDFGLIDGSIEVVCENGVYVVLFDFLVLFMAVCVCNVGIVVLCDIEGIMDYV